MERQIPENLLLLLERWFSICISCVKWCNAWSSWFTLRCGIRQGGVLSHCLFAIYIDGLVKKFSPVDMDVTYVILVLVYCCMQMIYYFWLRQRLHFRCYCLYMRRWEGEGDRVTYNMSMPKKSARLRIGPRYNAKCKHDLQRGRNIMG